MKKFSLIICSALLIALTFIFTGCVPKNAEKGVKKMQENGYKVEQLTTTEVAIMLEISTEFKSAYIYEKGDDFIIAIWFNSRKKAKEFNSMFEVHKTKISKQDREMDFTRKAKVFYFGTTNAIKDFK